MYAELSIDNKILKEIIEKSSTMNKYTEVNRYLLQRLNPLPVKGNLVFYSYVEVCCRKIFAAKCLDVICK
jgi:hypothetical protein